MTVILESRGLETGYGRIQVLWGINLKVEKGSITAILGPNGAGKTTLLRSIMGLTRAWRGSIWFNGEDITRLPPHKRVELGMALVPEGRRLFANLTVKENLLMGAYTIKNKEKIHDMLEYIFNLFPILKERLNQKAGTLSGGQQQMLAIARALITRPKLLMLDEPSQGLAPRVVLSIADALDKLREELDMSILLVEQNVMIALEKAEYIYFIEQGRITAEGRKEEVLKTDVAKAYLGL